MADPSSSLEPSLEPSQLLDQAPDLATARSMLLRTEHVNGTGWASHQVDPDAIRVEPHSHWWPPPPPFATHETFELPDHPPVDGAHSSPVHRFVLTEAAAAKVNAQLSGEAQQQTWGLKRYFAGETKSNVGGYHSHEEAFLCSLSERHLAGEWYGPLLTDVLLPALRHLDGEGAGGKAGVDADGVPLDGRITGWLNVNGVHGFNALHRHGTDVAWSLVYYVASGAGGNDAPPERAQKAEPAGVRGGDDDVAPLDDISPFDFVHHIGSLFGMGHQSPRAGAGRSSSAIIDPVAAECGGALLLRTELDSQTGKHGYFTIRPKPGELWCFPGYMAHAVMPRQLRNGGTATRSGGAAASKSGAADESSNGGSGIHDSVTGSSADDASRRSNGIGNPVGSLVDFAANWMARAAGHEQCAPRISVRPLSHSTCAPICTRHMRLY